MNPFDFLDALGDSSFPGRGWGRKRKFHGWGGGWVFPAMILGRILQEALNQQTPPPGPGPQPFPGRPVPQPGGPIPTPFGQTPPPAEDKTVQCANCLLEVKAGFAVCPHCGRSVNKRECRYCGRETPLEQNSCLGCGAPATAHTRR